MIWKAFWGIQATTVRLDIPIALTELRAGHVGELFEGLLVGLGVEVGVVL
jgi:hypothetical protein